MPSNEFQVDTAGPGDFDELMDLLWQSFRTVKPRHERFEVIFPDVCRPDPEIMERVCVARKSGRIVGCAWLIPIDLSLAGRAVRVAGIGNVAAATDYRGRGVMQRLLDQLISRIVAEGQYALAWLSGDRRRYQPWGFERVPTTQLLELSLRAPRAGAYELPTGCTCVRTAEVEPYWPEIARQLSELDYFAAGGLDALARKYRRRDQQGEPAELARAVGADEPAHVLTFPTTGQVLGWGGPPPRVGGLLAELLREREDGLTVWAPPPADPYLEMFNDFCGTRHLVTVGNLAIIDPGGTLRLYQELLDERVRRLGLRGEACLVLDAARQRPATAVYLVADGQTLRINPADVEPPAKTVTLSPAEMVRLFFDLDTAYHQHRLPAPARWLTALYPLPFYIPALYKV